MFKRRKPEDPPSSVPPSPGHDDLKEARPESAESDVGVQAFRSSFAKEPPVMARPPFPATPAPSNPLSTPISPTTNVPRPGLPPVRSPMREPSERRMLVVGRGISVQGTVQDAERLVVEGTVEATMIRATELSVAPGGMFKGEVEVDDAEIAGTIDGTLTAKTSLIVRASGRVLGTARCRRLQVEDGGQITGRIEMLSDSAPVAERPAESGLAS